MTSYYFMSVGGTSTTVSGNSERTIPIASGKSLVIVAERDNPDNSTYSGIYDSGYTLTGPTYEIKPIYNGILYVNKSSSAKVLNVFNTVQ